MSSVSLFLADMTFTNEGNKTYLDDLVNFEKMVSWSSSIDFDQRKRPFLRLFVIYDVL